MGGFALTGRAQLMSSARNLTFERRRDEVHPLKSGGPVCVLDREQPVTDDRSALRIEEGRPRSQLLVHHLEREEPTGRALLGEDDAAVGVVVAGAGGERFVAHAPHGDARHRGVRGDVVVVEDAARGAPPGVEPALAGVHVRCCSL